MSKGRSIALAAGAGTLGAAWWWRTHPSPCPYWQRFWLEAPHPGITRGRLIGLLDPHPGERILEIGPGTGYYSLPVSAYLGSEGRLELLDIQQDMLDHVERAASEQGIVNIAPKLGDARQLPFADGSLDASYLVTVLGEIPDRQVAIAEIARVLKPGGRLVVGELFGDPHYVSLGSMREQAEQAGLHYEDRVGNPLAFFARFTRPA
jgi:ubiquinone/menaquinone biosynthesis C-methylase UbiE